MQHGPHDINYDVLSRPNIEKRISQVQIMAHYLLPLDLNKIRSKRIRSPLRKDVTPSFVVWVNGLNIFWQDRMSGNGGTAYDFVMQKYNVDFKQAMAIINQDFGLGLRHKDDWKYPEREPAYRVKLDDRTHREVIITVSKRKQYREDVDFWGAYGIKPETLELYNVFPLRSAVVKSASGHSTVIVSSPRNPLYGYLTRTNRKYHWKLYRPKASKQDKWMSNVPGTIVQGAKVLDFTDPLLVITKSLKDVMVLHELGYNAIAFQSESNRPHQRIIERIVEVFSDIHIVYDFDLAGIKGVKYMKKLIPGIKIHWIQNMKTRHNGIKDLSDFAKQYGIDELEKCITLSLR